MTDARDARTEHPEELLAGYVDGSASPDDRRAVEAHLVSCSQCRAELELARTARAALLSLPELEAPGLAERGIEALGPATGDELAARREDRKQPGRQRQWQTSWVALGGVAAVLALLAIIPLVLTRGGGEQSAGGPNAPAASPTEAVRSQPVFDRGFDYDQDSVQALARQLANDVRTRRLSGGTPTPVIAPEGGAKTADTSSREVVQCAVQGTGLPSDTVPVYLEEATYRGTDAFIVAVLAEGENRDHLRVYAVSRQDCSFLYEADQPL